MKVTYRPPGPQISTIICANRSDQSFIARAQSTSKIAPTLAFQAPRKDATIVFLMSRKLAGPPARAQGSASAAAPPKPKVAAAAARHLPFSPRDLAMGAA